MRSPISTKTSVAVAILVAAVAGGLLSRSLLHSEAASTDVCNAATAKSVVVATNSYRTSLGLSQLKLTPKLVVFAARHAQDMAEHDVLTHASSTGLSFSARAHGSDYRFRTMRENVALEGAPLPDELGANLLDLWRNSPEHDANMRATDISQIGVAVAQGADGCYASMDLGKPLSP